MQTHVTKTPVTLEGFQAILSPGEWGHKLVVLIPKSLVDELEEERESCLEWAKSKHKNPKRMTVKHPAWEQLENDPDMYQIRFSWKVDDKLIPTVVDTEGTLITDKDTPLYSGSKVKLAFVQKPYLLPAGDIGTSVKLKCIQVISLNAGAGLKDEGNLTAEDAVELFGESKGFKVAEPNPTQDETAVEPDEDF